jgi:signal transduction histidine kinase
MDKNEGTLTPKPYARLLTMLSEQLIKNNTIALTEIAKNSYDADADWVQIRIGNMDDFGKDNLKENEKPFVEIEDCGDGMSLEIIKKHWMNPASPHKFLKRSSGENKTKKGRIIQGEKGIGRYSVFKIGKKVEIYSREKIIEDVGNDEIYLVTDLSQYSEELIFERSEYKRSREKYGDFLFKKEILENEPLYFDEIKSKYKIIKDQSKMKILDGDITIEGKKEKRKNHGTFIRITELNEIWKKAEVEKIRRILADLQSPFRKKDFAVSIMWEDEEISAFDKYSLEDVLKEADLAIEGNIDENGMCNYKLSKYRMGEEEDIEEKEFDLVNELKNGSIRENREHFFKEINGKLERFHNPICGPFSFKFYIYDMTPSSNLDKDLKEYIKKHRIYIYRDDIRIYPYGDHDNDWIKLDIYRGLVRASYYLSNDQTIGYVNISGEENKNLRDKTNREGLIEQGTAYEDLRLLTLSILNFLNREFRKLKSKPKAKERDKRQDTLALQTQKVDKEISKIDKYFKDLDDPKGKKMAASLAMEYRQERKVLNSQIELVEDLAGVGIAVDAASHDIMVMMERMGERIEEIREISYSESINTEKLKDKIDALQGQFLFVDGLLKGIQPIFRSARRKSKKLRIVDIIKRVERYYKNPLRKLNIKEIEIEEMNPPLIVKGSEGVLLQLFINLLDNAVYWLRVAGPEKPQIKVLIDGNRGYAIFADNGNGVRKKDVDYIFEPFFSTKGLEGRGLGLYIARQLTDRYEYDLYYVENEKDKILPGANFRINFIEQEN